MAHPLDRPIWNALTTRQAHLAQGDARAWRFDPDYNLFAAAADGSAANLEALGALLSAGGDTWLVEAEEMPAPPCATVLSRPALHQMIAPSIAQSAHGFEITPLTEEDAPEMRALALLTKPGPFFTCTHRLGEFLGIKQDGRLMAMAGERMKPEGFTEVSGVCTHPDHRGRGYAGTLMRAVAEHILDRGETPFLHVYAANGSAIALYESLGFTLRRPMAMAVLARAG